MTAVNEQEASFFEAVRADDVAMVQRLLAGDASRATARWPGRAGDAKMRSLGSSPFNQHKWLRVPDGHAPDDPRFTSTPLIYTRNDQIAQMLVEAGADVNARGTSGELEMPDWFFTPLWRAAHDGRIITVRLLVERGGDVNYATPDGANQALKTGAENDRGEVCEYLLGHGARPDLITAAMLGLPDHVAALLEAQPQAIHIRDSHGRSAMDAATLCDTFRSSRTRFHAGHDQVAEILIQCGATVDLAHTASLGRFDEIERMVENDPDILRRPIAMVALIGGTAVKESPLSAATRRGRKDIAECLVAHGATEKRQILWT